VEVAEHGLGVDDVARVHGSFDFLAVNQQVEMRLCGDFDIVDRRMGFGNCFADFTHRFEMGGQCVLEIASCFFRSVAGRSASGNVWRVGGIARPCLLDDYRITSHAHFRPAFLSIAFSVPVASSFPFPGHRDNDGLFRMLEMAMATLGSHLNPSILFQ
jgi:hypothetical protein